MTDQWYSYRGEPEFDLRSIFNYRYAYEWDVGEPWRAAKAQYEYFSDPANGFINGGRIVVNSIERIQYAANNLGIQPGDLMYFAGEGGEGVHHAVIITKVENGEIFYYGHTNPATYKPLSEALGKETVFIIRIKDLNP